MIASDVIGSDTIPTKTQVKGNGAVLFLYSPRQMNDHYKRPIVYNFNQNVMHTVIDKMYERKDIMSGIPEVLNTKDIAQAIIPATQGFGMKTSSYSDSWTFVAIIDEAAGHSGIFNNVQGNRSIAIGICSQEPIGKQGLQSATPEQFINPNCQLIITRRLVMNTHSRIGPQGASTGNTVLHDTNLAGYDNDVWSPNTVESNSEKFYSLEADSVFDSTTYGEQVGNISEQIIVTNPADSINARREIKIEATQENPRHHMRDLLSVVDRGMDGASYHGDLGQFGDNELVMGSSGDSFRAFCHNEFNKSSEMNDSLSDIPADKFNAKFITIGMFCTTYSPKVIPVITPPETPATIIPQHVTSPSTIFSSLVSSCIPTYLNGLNISAVGFTYNSYADAVQVDHIDTMADMTPDELRFKWGALFHLLKTELFPILQHNGGHFELSIMSSITSTTNVVLNFLDNQLLAAGELYQENTILGGIVSPLIGTQQNVSHNSRQINNLLSTISDVVDHNNSGFY